MLCCLILTVVFISSCEKESLEIIEAKELSKDNRKFNDFVSIKDMIESDFDLESYRDNLPKSVSSKTVNVASKFIVETTGTTFYTDKVEFEGISCGGLVLEDFETSSNSYTFGAMTNPLDEYTDNHFYSPGDIKSGIVVRSNDEFAKNDDFDLFIYEWDGVNRMVSSFYFADYTIIDFEDDVFAVSMELFRYLTSGVMEIEVFAESGSIGTYSVNVGLYNQTGTFIGVKTEVPITKITLNGNNDGGNFYGDSELIDNLYFGNSDSDGDGCCDVDDPIINSNMETTIVIDGCDYGVKNYMTSNCGVTMSDMIDELEGGTYRNHGAFVRAMANLVEGWYLEGLLTLEEKDLIMMCAGESSIGSKK